MPSGAARFNPSRTPSWWLNAASKPSSLNATFSGEPAEPMTVCPRSLAIWPAGEPTVPAAPDTNTMSPADSAAMSSRPT